MAGRTTLAPPKIPGATYVGTKECIQCHGDKTEHFGTASHARLAIADAKVGPTEIVFARDRDGMAPDGPAAAAS